MEHTFDLAGARRAAEAGLLMEWTLAKVMREGRANRPLAAILRGQRPTLSGPTLVPLDGLESIAGGEPGLKYSRPMAQWEAELAPLLREEPEDQPPLLLRYGRHVADGNHRVEVWRRRGLSHGWAIVWEDSDPAFRDWWTPFPPEVSPTFEQRDDRFVALSRGEVVGSFRLRPEGGGLLLSDLWVDPAWRGLRLGSRMLRVARSLFDGHQVTAQAPESLIRFFSETGFVPVEPSHEGRITLRRPAS